MEKTTIKTLATDLKIDHNTLLREVKKLNINAKNTISVLTDEDVITIREHYKNHAESEDSTIPNGDTVIVRRRRVAEAKENTPSEKVSTEITKETEENSKHDNSDEKVKTEISKEENKEETNNKKAFINEKEVSKSMSKEENSAKSKSSSHSKNRKSKKTERIETPARVITPVAVPVPTPVPVEMKEEKVEVKEEKISENIQENSVNTSKEKHFQNQNKQKTAEKPKERNDDRNNRNDRDKKKSASISATPDGSSTKSILPPAGERSFAAQNEHGEFTSQVRVISKPTPQQSKENAEHKQRDRQERSDYRSRNNNRNDGNRQDNDRPRSDRPRSDRPRSDRPQGQRPFGQNKDASTSGFNKDKDTDQRRQTRPQNARPSRPVEPIPFPTEEQSRKKRNKNKKSNDNFDSAPQQDFKFSKYSFDMDGDDMPRRRRKPKKKETKTVTTTAPMKAAKRKLRIEETIRVADMAHQMGLKSSEIIKILFGLGVMATINSSLDFDTASVVAAEFEYEVEKVGFSAEEAILPTEPDLPEQLKPRPPVVTIMGHVDHGKTSLLDAIRETNVTAGEAGGITQHIGAYHVRTKRGEIVFLDTPGHEAFTAMRLRGAQVTDIVVLVVAADDGVMEQTREAINHARAANVPIIVAVNKMDKEGANPDRVLRELAELGLQSEEWGGDTVTAKLSAKKREGIDELLELLVLQAELMELKANPDKSARGHIVEAKLDKGRGSVATVLIQEGTLNQGDAFVCGVFSGRVRALFNDQGKKIQSAGPSIPVEVQGFEGVPDAGEEFVSLQDEKMARRIADARAIKQREKVLAKESKVTLETFLSRKADATEALVLNLIIKADVQGSLEAIKENLNKLSTEKVRINVLHGGAGSISETDIMLAAASEAIVIGFNVRPTAKVKEVAENEHVDIRFYDIIYKLAEEIQAAMTGLLAPVQKEVYLGQAEVRQIFTLSRVGTIAGSYVVDGKMSRNSGIRLLREGVVIYTGKISSLKRVKDDAKEVVKGLECGISLENYNDIKVGDIIEAFEMQEEAAKL